MVLGPWASYSIICCIGALHRDSGSLHVSGKLPTYPSPKPAVCATWEVSGSVGLGEGFRDSSRYLLQGIIRFTDRLYRDSFELTLKAYALLLWNYKAQFKVRTFHAPNLIPSIKNKYIKRTTLNQFGSTHEVCSSCLNENFDCGATSFQT